MRETEIAFSRGRRLAVALVLGLLGSSLACKSDESKREPAATAKPEAEPAAEPGAEKPAATAAASKSSEAAEDPQRADKLADLDALCKALDHDYIDGTLSDYYRDVELRTDWGKAQRDAGNVSIQPGRLLEKAVAELSPTAAEPIEHCRKLLDYIDDLE